MTTLIPVPELTKFMSNLEPPSFFSKGQIPFVKVWILKRENKVFLPEEDKISPVHEYGDCEIVGMLKFLWNGDSWSLFIKSDVDPIV